MTGRAILNPISGERIFIRTAAAETNGELLAFDLFLPPGGHVPATHVHPHQEERFTVIGGRMRFKLRGGTIVAGEGETVVVPRGAVHWFGNAGREIAQAYVEVRPALRMQELLERTGVLGRRQSRVKELVIMLQDFQHELAVPHVPTFLVRAALMPLGWIARHA